MRRIHAAALFLSLSCSLGGCALEHESCDTDAGADADTADASQSCPDDSVCLDIQLLETDAPRTGRLAVMWYQLSDVAPDPEPQIAWEGALDPTARRIVIPLSAIAVPTDQALLLCERACTDEARCPCRGTVQVGIATVVAADDVNRDGRIDVREVADAPLGRGDLVVARSETQYRTAPPPFDRVFADSIRKGTRAYRIIDEGGGNVRIGSPEEHQAFDLKLCSQPGTRCAAPLPNLRAF